MQHTLYSKAFGMDYFENRVHTLAHIERERERENEKNRNTKIESIFTSQNKLQMKCSVGMWDIMIDVA